MAKTPHPTYLDYTRAPVDDRVPASARWLGWGGTIPFIVLAGAVSGETSWTLVADQALKVYGAVILSFLGGVHWGLAMSRYGGAASSAVSGRWVILSVLPPLAGWAAVVFAHSDALPLLAAAFALMMFIDLRTVKNGCAPLWYPKLRWPLTVVVMLCLLVAAF